MTTHIFSRSKLFPELAARIEKEIKENISNHNVLLFLSGGSCVKVYPYLAKSILTLFRNSEDDDIQNLTILQVDERFQPGKKEDTNAFQIEKTGLWKACQKAQVEYYMISQERSLEDSADYYNDTIKKFNISRMPQFDKSGNQRKKKMYQIGVFGIGEDGHTAGLVPGYKSNWDIGTCCYVGYENSGPFKKRISLTPSSIKKIDMAFILASGKKKKKAIHKLKSSRKLNADIFPASILLDIPNSEIFTDQKFS